MNARQARRAWRRERDKRIAAYYEANPSLRSTAKLFGLSHEGVRKILNAQGVTIAPPCTWSISVAAHPLGNVEQLRSGVSPGSPDRSTYHA